MSKELIDFRPWLERLTSTFGDEQLIPVKKAAAFCGIDIRRLMSDTTFPVKKIVGRYYVPVIALARWLSKCS